MRSVSRSFRARLVAVLTAAVALTLVGAISSISPAAAALPNSANLYVDGNGVTYSGPTTIYSGDPVYPAFSGTVIDSATGQPFDPHSDTYDLGSGPTRIAMIPSVDTQGVAGVSCQLQGENDSLTGVPVWNAPGAAGTGIYDDQLSEPFHLATTLKCTNTTGETHRVLLKTAYYAVAGELPDSMYPQGYRYHQLACQPAGYCGEYLLVKPDSTPFTLTATPASQRSVSDKGATVNVTGTWPLDTIEATFSRSGCVLDQIADDPSDPKKATLHLTCTTPGVVTATITASSAFDPWAGSPALKQARTTVHLTVVGTAPGSPSTSRRTITVHRKHVAANRRTAAFRIAVKPADAHRLKVQVRHGKHWRTLKTLPGRGGRVKLAAGTRVRVIAPADAHAKRLVWRKHLPSRL